MADQDTPQGASADMITMIYRLAVVILLAGILMVQWQTMNTVAEAAAPPPEPVQEEAPAPITPTIGELRKARGAEAKQEIIDRIPLMRIQGVQVRGGALNTYSE